MRADDVERGGLAGEHPAAASSAPEHERPEAVRVAHADEAGVVHQHEREAALAASGSTCSSASSSSRPSERGSSGVLVGDELGDERGVGGGVEARSASGGRGPGACRGRSASSSGVGEVAVVAEREAGVADRAVDRAGRCATLHDPVVRVADVADGEVALERGEAALVEHLGDEAHVLRPP